MPPAFLSEIDAVHGELLARSGVAGLAGVGPPHLQRVASGVGATAIPLGGLTCGVMRNIATPRSVRWYGYLSH